MTRWYRMQDQNYINLDSVSYVEWFDSYAVAYVWGRQKGITVAGNDYVKLRAYFVATADSGNQPSVGNTNPAAVSPDPGIRTLKTNGQT